MHYNISYGHKWIGEKTIDPVRYTITSISIPETVKYIADNAFHDCYNLREIVIPENIVSIGTMAFYNCKHLQSVRIDGNNFHEILNLAFQDCLELKEINIPNSIETIGDFAFYGCDRLKNLILPDNNYPYLYTSALDGSGIEIIDIPNSCYMPYNQLSFDECKNLKTIIIHTNDHNISISCPSQCEIIKKEQ